MRTVRRLIPNVYLVLALVFIYLPIAILIVYSFNALPKSFIWGGFSIDNYKNLFTGSEGMGILDSLLETLKVAAIASVCDGFRCAVRSRHRISDQEAAGYSNGPDIRSQRHA